MADNVTPLHPAPSIPNPLHANPWARLTDEELRDAILRSQVRIEAAQHTLRSLTREVGRRRYAEPEPDVEGSER